MKKYDVVIIGGGPAGTTAGYLLSKAGYKTDELTREQLEGIRTKLIGLVVSYRSI